MAFLYSPALCGKSIKIILFDTTLKKILPQSLIDILGAEHCNSAVTTTCSQKGDIIIYRREEWFKVFIHETFHLLCLDFANMPTYILSEFNKNTPYFDVPFVRTQINKLRHFVKIYFYFFYHCV